MSHQLYTVIEWDSVEYGAFMGVYTTIDDAYRAACVAANSVTLFVDDVHTDVDKLANYLTEHGNCVNVHGEKGLTVRIFYSEIHTDDLSIAFPVFSMEYEGLRRYMGTYLTILEAYAAACRAANSVTLFDVQKPFHAIDLENYMDLFKDNIILTGETEDMAIVMYAPLNQDFITNN